MLYTLLIAATDATATNAAAAATHSESTKKSPSRLFIILLRWRNIVASTHAAVTRQSETD